MKKLLYIFCLALLSVGLVRAQQPAAGGQPYRVVFDLTSRDTLDQKAVLRMIKEISSAATKADEIEVVMYGRGLEMVVPEKSTFIDGVKEAMKNPNVAFKVCEIAMKNQKVDKSQLLPGVQTVPDGIYEIMSKQRAGWGYIKVSH